jgi:hypothetical protein
MKKWKNGVIRKYTRDLKIQMGRQFPKKVKKEDK